MKLYIKRIDTHENGLIARARDEPLLQRITYLNEYRFKKMLLQKRFVSFQFTPLYDEALCFLSDEKAKKAVRWLRNEEYPKGKSSHREDLFHDLFLLGISKRCIGKEKASLQTMSSIDRLYNLVRYKTGEDELQYDVRCIAGLRMAEEILVAEEYRVFLVEFIRRYGISKEWTHFYGPHYDHDQKNISLGKKGKNHSDLLGSVLTHLVTDEKEALCACKALDDAYEARMVFYEQFN